MPTECSAEPLLFAPVESRSVVAAFDGGVITSDAGALLLGATDQAIDLVRRLARCFTDRRLREASSTRSRRSSCSGSSGWRSATRTLNDHDALRHDPMMAVLAGKLSARRAGCAAVAGKSTLNGSSDRSPRRRATTRSATTRKPIEALFVDMFPRGAPQATKRRSCSTSMPPTTPCTATRRDASSTAITGAIATCRSTSSAARHLLAAKLRRADIDASARRRSRRWRASSGAIRARWPHVRILLRADSGFAREPLMAWLRGQRHRLRHRPRPQHAARRGDRRRDDPGRGGGRAQEGTGAPLQGLPLCDARQLVAAAPRRREGGMDAWQGQPALRRDVALEGQDRRARPLRTALLRARRDGEPFEGMPGRAVRRPHLDGGRWAPTSCACGSPLLPMC